MSSDTEWTIGRLLQWTTEHFQSVGSSSARLDAEVLLAEACQCQRIELYTAFAQVADDEVRQTFRDLVRRRAAGEPVAYLVGQREFYSLPFHVSPAVLIPRPETELLVMTLLESLKQRDEGKEVNVVDVGTGSGCIAISTAKHAPDARVTAIDADPKALAVAKQNAETLGVAEQIRFVQGDLLDGLDASEQFDFVVSNPPYVSRAEWEGLEAEVREFEPTQALVGGETGVEIISRLIPQAAQRLQEGGSCMLEISPMIHARVIELLQASGNFLAPETVKDLSGHPRVLHARHKSDSPITQDSRPPTSPVAPR